MAVQALYGLIGFPLEHSFSPGYFNTKFEREKIDAAYRAFPLENISELGTLLHTPYLKGLNVTIPYKEQVIPLLDELHPDAADVRAVNCIHIKDGRTTGYNTDVIGFEKSLTPLLRAGMIAALVLGTGGAAKAVGFVLDKLGIEYQMVSRSKDDGAISYSEVTEAIIRHHQLIINTTPLGMHPGVEQYPSIPYDAVTPEHLLYDLVYNPPLTKFLELGRQKGAAIKNGHEMLVLQAEASWHIWNS